MRLRNPELHAAVLAAPDDDAPRMVYADWLIERGDPRGELIARMLRGLDIKDLAVKYEIEHELKNVSVTWSRGFIESMSAKAEWLQHPDLGDACVRELWVGSWLPPPDVSEVALRLAPDMRLRKLGLEGPGDIAAFEALMQSPHLAGVEQLDLSAQLPDERWLAAVVGARLPRLHGLDLFGCSLDLARVRRIADAFELHRLHLSNNAIGPRSLATLAASPGLRALEDLDVGYTGITDDDIVALVRSDLPLRRLVLQHNPIGTDAIRAIASSPWSARLDQLDVHEIGLTREGLDILMASPHLRRDLELGLDGMVLGLHPNIEYDSEDVRCGGYWTREPPPEVTARFRVAVLGQPP